MIRAQEASMGPSSMTGFGLVMTCIFAVLENLISAGDACIGAYEYVHNIKATRGIESWIDYTIVYSIFWIYCNAVRSSCKCSIVLVSVLYR